ncbi:MAG: hypothetical protein P4L91_10500 [Burkholderiaceae bacterium]|nr:hypothetical protein [Burkholderiaceae bacterium]
MQSYLPFFFVFIVAGICVRVYYIIHARKLILKWVAENNQYIVQKESIQFRIFRDPKFVNIVATDSCGIKVRIVLRLGPKWMQGVIDNAVCESITPFEKR